MTLSQSEFFALPRIAALADQLTDSTKQTIEAFAATVPATARLLLLTGGGTRVPLEVNAVRFVDNFSTGRRAGNVSIANDFVL